MDQQSAYVDDDRVGVLTKQAVAAGHPILQSHKLAASDVDHVLALHNHFKPPPFSHILDVGCGVGEVARIMAAYRPDLRWTLLNISPAQLGMAPAMPKVAGDMHALPFDRIFDATMFCYSLGHGNLERCMSEAARVLRPGGIFFAYELTAIRPDDLVPMMGYRPHHRAEVEMAAERYGMFPEMMIELPDASPLAFVNLVGSQEFAKHGFDRAWPMIYRFVRNG